MTEQTKQKLKDVLIEHKNISASEYDDDDAFVGIYFSDLVDIINSVIHNTGWHSASELPELNEYGNSELVYALYGTNNSRLSPIISCVIEGKWHDDNIKWWCYPHINL